MIVKNSRSNFATGMGKYLKSTDTYNENAPFSAVVGKFEYVGGCTGGVIMCHWTKNGSGSRESWKFFRN